MRASAMTQLLAAAQTLQPAPSAAPPMPTPIDALGDDLAQAFAGRSLFFYGGAVLATGIMAYGGADQAIRVWSQRDLVAPGYADGALYTGYIFPLVAAPAVYFAGLATRHRGIAGAGGAALQALAVTFVTTSVLKLAVGRVYPLNGGARDAPDRLEHPDYAHELHPFQRLDWPSLPAWPSGHTSSSVSVVAALTAYYPEEFWIPLVGYPVALAIGFGMVDGDRHWASDVVGGALIGQAIGYSVGRAFRTRNVDVVRDSASGPTLVPLTGSLWGLGVDGTW